MEYSIQKDSYVGIPKCYKPMSAMNLESAGILPILRDSTLSVNGQGVSIIALEQAGENAQRMEEVIREASPGAEVVMREMQDAPKDLKEFFFIPRDTFVVAETDILKVVQEYMERAEPTVLCLPLGCNNGSHSGDGLLSSLLNQFALRDKHAVVVAAGNEGANAHHYKGVVDSVLSPKRVQILVPKNLEGFYVELWCLPPERVEVTVQSPTGEISPLGTSLAPENITYTYLFERTRVEIDYRDVGISNRDQLVFIRFEKPVEGIWTINVYPKYTFFGEFHMWLPAEGLLGADVVFLEPNPDNTITTPGDAKSVITVGGFDVLRKSVFLETGRGYNIDGTIKPDFLAPCEENRFLGTSVAAGITAGAAALCLQWALEREGTEAINGVDIRDFLIRGCTRREDTVYPNTLEGYGNLNLYESFLTLKL